VLTRERGQATPIMAMVLVMAAAIALALIHLGTVAADSARAGTAADAAALAGAAEGRAAATTVATANHGRLVSFVEDGDDVIVAVTVGRVTARARASATWPAPSVPP